MNENTVMFNSDNDIGRFEFVIDGATINEVYDGGASTDAGFSISVTNFDYDIINQNGIYTYIGPADEVQYPDDFEPEIVDIDLPSSFSIKETKPDTIFFSVKTV